MHGDCNHRDLLWRQIRDHGCTSPCTRKIGLPGSLLTHTRKVMSSLQQLVHARRLFYLAWQNAWNRGLIILKPRQNSLTLASFFALAGELHDTVYFPPDLKKL